MAEKMPPRLALGPLSWLNLPMRLSFLLLLTACPFDQPSGLCPEQPCLAPLVCAAEGDCVRLIRRDVGSPDSGPAPDAGPQCGNAIVEAGEECDDANVVQTDGCLEGCIAARCGDGFLRSKTEDCDVQSEECSSECRRVGDFDGSDAAKAALSCRHLKRDHPELPSAGYWLDLDGSGEQQALRVFCEMGLDGGGWTQMAHLRQGDTLWNAWLTRHAAPGGDHAWGLRLADLLQDDADGQDIEYLFALRGTFAGVVVYSPFYSGLRGGAFDPEPVFEVFDEDGFDWREVGFEKEHCASRLWHRTEAWNWAAARGEFGCDGWSGGAGFIIHGSESSSETAQTVWGMQLFGSGSRGAEFSSFELYAR